MAPDSRFLGGLAPLGGDEGQTPCSVLANSLTMPFMSTAPRSGTGPTLGGRVFFVWFGDHEQTLT
jgi:hypothetical protein